MSLIVSSRKERGLIRHSIAELGRRIISLRVDQEDFMVENPKQHAESLKRNPCMYIVLADVIFST